MADIRPDRTSSTSGTAAAARPPRSLRPAIQVLDVGAEGVGLLSEPEWSHGARNSKTLLKTESLRVVLTALRAGETLSNEDPDEAIAIHGLQGDVAVRVDDEEVSVGMGQLVCLAGGDPWRVTATADSLFLLIVGRARTGSLASRD
jgi:quercetin dioxygenase-like cupin family protein